MMTHVLMERRYKPSPEDMLLKAFHVLDTENKQHLLQDELTKYMTEEGKTGHYSLVKVIFPKVKAVSQNTTFLYAAW